jgi:hypothetical protein
VTAGLPRLRHTLVAGGPVPAGARSWDALVEAAPATPPPAPADDPAAATKLMYTSGTTGVPKGVVSEPGVRGRLGPVPRRRAGAPGRGRDRLLLPAAVPRDVPGHDARRPVERGPRERRLVVRPLRLLAPGAGSGGGGLHLRGDHPVGPGPAPAPARRRRQPGAAGPGSRRAGVGLAGVRAPLRADHRRGGDRPRRPRAGRRRPACPSARARWAGRRPASRPGWPPTVAGRRRWARPGSCGSGPTSRSPCSAATWARTGRCWPHGTARAGTTPVT